MRLCSARDGSDTDVCAFTGDTLQTRKLRLSLLCLLHHLQMLQAQRLETFSTDWPLSSESVYLSALIITSCFALISIEKTFIKCLIAHTLYKPNLGGCCRPACITISWNETQLFNNTDLCPRLRDWFNKKWGNTIRCVLFSFLILVLVYILLLVQISCLTDLNLSPQLPIKLLTWETSWTFQMEEREEIITPKICHYF